VDPESSAVLGDLQREDRGRLHHSGAVLRGPVLTKGATPALQDIVYRSTFEYDPVTDALTFWFSGARYESGRYRWGAAVERHRRTAVFEVTGDVVDPRSLPAAPAPLDDWP